MSYVVLARKWRPQRFEDLVGQDHVAKTLSNAIVSGRVAHAFLFTGVRGVGKTTSARLLARALNCLSNSGAVTPGNPVPPNATPCLSCDSCREIGLGTDVDVREIDGASYNGVDEVRKLQDSLPYRPARDRYKIFIIDEVHMLSNSAWNAFLKTLEEPPDHVKFIFATTEAHKIPVTILSRVQRFDFKLIPTRLIMDRLRQVLTAENIPCDEAALSVLAHEAAGSMRDAMSLLDQVLAWNADSLEGASVARVLGVASRQVLHEILAALVSGDASQCLHLVDQVAQQGFDMVRVARDLLSLLRDLVVARVCADPSRLLDLPDQEQAQIVGLASSSGLDDVLRLYHGTSLGYDELARSGQPRASLEMLLVRLARRPPLLPIDELVSRLGALERRLCTPQRQPPTGGGPVAGPSTRSSSGSGGRSEAHGGRDAPRSRTSASQNRAAPTESGSEADTVEDGVSEASVSSAVSVLSLGPSNDAHQPPAVAADAEPTLGGDPEQTLALWQEVLEGIAPKHPEIAACLAHATLLCPPGKGLTIAWPPGSVLADQFEESQLCRLVAESYTERTGLVAAVGVERESRNAKDRPTLAKREVAERAQRRRTAQAKVRTHPMVAAAVDILGARVKEVKPVGF